VQPPLQHKALMELTKVRQNTPRSEEIMIMTVIYTKRRSCRLERG
jgi:hypothetical protein